jgi:hypothetical protein
MFDRKMNSWAIIHKTTLNLLWSLLYDSTWVTLPSIKLFFILPKIFKLESRVKHLHNTDKQLVVNPLITRTIREL